MRISDWSSDVCSSDLLDLALFAARISGGQAFARLQFADRLGHLEPLGEHIDERRVDIVAALAVAAKLVVHGSAAPHFFGLLGTGQGEEIGLAPGRDSVCWYVLITVVHDSFKTKQKHRP